MLRTRKPECSSFRIHVCVMALIILAVSINAGFANDDLPIVPEGFVVDTIAKEPVVSNPCVLAFDRLGRLCVAQGPQWRAPTPETPGDRVDILIDADGDGQAETRKTFAEGFNSIQGMAWYGNDLWVANAPDLTVVRDTDGDDEADEYLRVYTGLGNLEHCLHGLNFGPDGKLYMSKGNSKGYNHLDQLAPKAFRDLWGLASPEGAPDYTPIETFTKETYQRKYHTPNDDWGQQGGILRCTPYVDEKVSARELEIFSRGFRNPWDICFDDQFNWLGTDNDQTQGDRIFTPFHGAHYGWGHRWSFHWTGEGHLPTVPNSADLFEGSGTGVIHYHAQQFPEDYQNVFFVNDWMRREIYLFRPRWDGALMKCVGDFPETFAHAQGGRSLPSSSGRVFEPTDIEVGPDGTLYVLSWGHAYGGTLENGQQVDLGRVYRIRHQGRPLQEWNKDHRTESYSEWSFRDLMNDLGSSVPAWRVNAQLELLKRGTQVKQQLLTELSRPGLSQAAETWILWTLGRLSADDDLEQFLVQQLQDGNENRQQQALRILACRVREFAEVADLPEEVVSLLSADNPRLRHEVVQAIWQADQQNAIHALLDRTAVEQDRVVFHSLWKAIGSLAEPVQRLSWLQDSRSGLRLAALLGLLEDGLVTGDEVMPLRDDSDPRVAALANDWLVKTGAAAPLVQFNPPAGEYSQPVSVSLSTTVGGAFLTYTLDGSRPTFTSPRVGGPIPIERSSQLRVAVNQGNNRGSLYASADYEIRFVPPYRHRPFVTDVRTPSGLPYELDWTGLQSGKPFYTDRDYQITDVPAAVSGLPFIRPANNDDRSSGDEWLTFGLLESCEVIVGVDTRNNAPLEWMKIGQPGGFEAMGLELLTADADFHLYRKQYPAGRVVLGGNTNLPQSDSGRGNYLVIFRRQILPEQPSTQGVDVEQVLAAMPQADADRGRELFLSPLGAGCYKCHRMEGLGSVLAPDLTDIGTRAKTPRVLIESILQPSKVITEGFAQQQIVTVEGKIYAGAVVEETGTHLKLASSEGKVTTIPRNKIEERIGTKISPMPAGFGKMMTAQQVADLTAWLLTQTVSGDREGFSFRDRTETLEIFWKKQRLATYLKQHSQLTRRALVNVMTPGGLQVTRNFPPRKPEDIDPGYGHESGIIHPVMHPGLWIGFGDVDGNDYWRLQAEVKFSDFVKRPWGTRMDGGFAVKNLLMNEQGNEIVCAEMTTYQFRKTSEGYLLLIDAEYRSDEREFYFGDQEESGLAVRVASPLRVQGGQGTILNDRAEKNATAMWGKEAKWFDYFGRVQNRDVGVMVVSDPDNLRASWLHARDYGVVVTNPFPKQPKERREPYVKTWIKQGETFRLSYAVLVHDLPADQPLDREAAYQQILKIFQEEHSP